MTKNDFHCKWNKIFVSKRYATKSEIILTASEQQELLDDVKSIDVQVTYTNNASSKAMDDHEFSFHRHWKKEDDDSGDDGHGGMKHFQD